MTNAKCGMGNGCHPFAAQGRPERSEGSVLAMEMLRFAQHDTAHSAFTIPHSYGT
jgi:hypothetical protein